MAAAFESILVTGGAGFIGSNFVRYMLAAHPGYRIVVYDKLTYAGNPDNLLGLEGSFGARYGFIHGDICDSAQVTAALREFDVHAVINFAAETHVDRSLIYPHDFVETNGLGLFHLLEAARACGVARFHQVSSDEVYGQVLQGSSTEDGPLRARNPYSATKGSADLLVQAYFASFGLPATITRGTNNIGPYQYPEKAVPLFITNALEGKPLPVYGDGRSVRDYQYVLDHCRGIDFVFHHGLPGEIYNLGSGSQVEALTLARLILDQLEKPHSLIRLVSDRPGQDRRYSLDCAKVRALGWRPRWTFEQALAATVAWYVENEWWWRKLKDGEYEAYYQRQYRERLEQADPWAEAGGGIVTR